MEINSTTPYVPLTIAENIQQRQEYSSALSAALKTGNLGAAQEAIFGLKGAGGLSPASLFSKIEQAVKSGNLDGAKNVLDELQGLRKNPDLQPFELRGEQVQELERGHFPGIGALVSTKA